MKKVIAFLLAIITAANLCFPAFAEEIDYSQMDIGAYVKYKNQRNLELDSYYSKPTKSLLYYKTARLSDAEAEKQAEDIGDRALVGVFGIYAPYCLYVQIEYNFYIYNKKVFNKAVDKIYAKQERFFAAYGDKFESEGQFMTKEHIAGELYIHMCLYELTYRLTFISSVNELYKRTKLIGINPYNEISDDFIDAVGKIAYR